MCNFHGMKSTEPHTTSCCVRDVDLHEWCRALRLFNLHRPWDLLFPPKRLYFPNSTFDVGSHLRFGIIHVNDCTVAAFVIALRETDCCLIDVRCAPDAPDQWVELLLDHWNVIANKLGAYTMTGPVGAFAFLTDGVSESDTAPPDSIHISCYPEILVASLRRRGYVHAWSGAIWGRQGAVGTAHATTQQPNSRVRVGSWMNIISIARRLETVLSLSFSTLSWHRGSGAALVSLVRAYAPIFTPRLALTAGDTSVIGAVLLHKDISSVPAYVYSMPRLLQVAWLRIAASRSQTIHASVIGLLPEARNSRAGAELFYATTQAFDHASAVTTSWIRNDNRASQAMASRAGLRPIQQRFVFRLVCQSCSTSEGE